MNVKSRVKDLAIIVLVGTGIPVVMNWLLYFTHSRAVVISEAILLSAVVVTLFFQFLEKLKRLPERKKEKYNPDSNDESDKNFYGMSWLVIAFTESRKVWCQN